MKICILGAGGVFGNNLAAFLLSQNHEVMGIGRSPRKPKCFSLGVDYPYYAYHLTYEQEYAVPLIWRFRPDAIVNFAAQGEGAASFGKDNWRFFDTNCTALVRLVSQLEGLRFIQIGSSEVYGSVHSAVSEDSPTYPTTPYSASKLAFDHYLAAMHKFTGMTMNIVRPSNCVAEGQQLHRIVPKALLCGLTGRRVPLHGGGVAKKSYLHATDLSRAILTIIERGTVGEIYNVGPDGPTEIREVVRLCAHALNMQLEDLAEIAPERTGQDSTYWIDSSKIKALSWEQRIPLSDAITRVLGWLHTYPELLTMPTDFQMRA